MQKTPPKYDWSCTINVVGNLTDHTYKNHDAPPTQKVINQDKSRVSEWVEATTGLILVIRTSYPASL